MIVPRDLANTIVESNNRQEILFIEKVRVKYFKGYIALLTLTKYCITYLYADFYDFHN
jgi:hypothetical protein